MSNRESRTGVAVAVLAMSFVQLGLAASVGLFDRLGPEGAAWLRLSFAAVIVLVLFRPRVSAFDRRSLLAAVGLGVATGAMTLLFMAAAARIPLGVASALEFLGPLTVAVLRNRPGARDPRADSLRSRTNSRRSRTDSWTSRTDSLRSLSVRSRAGLVWPAMAFVGVLLLTQPWRFVGDSAAVGSLDVLGVLFALAAAVCWASYILLTQHVGDNVTGLQGMGVSIPVAALVATVVAGPSTIPLMTWELVAIGFGLALLLPVIPFTLEYLALRRLDAGVFGTLMSLEPALALLVGWLLLHQAPGLLPAFGIAFVVVAGMGAERTSAPRHAPPTPPDQPSPDNQPTPTEPPSSTGQPAPTGQSGVLSPG